MVIDTSGGGRRQPASEFDDGDGQRWPLVFDGGDGRLMWQQWTKDTMFNGGGGGGVRWLWQYLTVFGGIFDGLRQGDDEAKMASTTRGQERGTKRSNTLTSGA